MQNCVIFIVDDDLFSLHHYQQGLLDLGFTKVKIFESGSHCVDNLHIKPLVVFLDHCMQNLNGFEVLKKIKCFDPQIYVVIISANEDPKTSVDSRKHGAFDYIHKNGLELLKMNDALKRIKSIQEVLMQNTSVTNSNHSLLTK